MVTTEEAAILEIAESFPSVIRHFYGKASITAGMYEFTFSQMRAMGFVVDHPGCTMGELAQALGIGLSAATGLIDRLVQHGFMEREADANDRRIVRIYPSEIGEKARQQWRSQRTQRLQDALKLLSPEERQQVAIGLELLRKVLKAVESAKPERGSK